MARTAESESLRAEDMDIVGNLFGIRFMPGFIARPAYIELYIEDDERFYLTAEFAESWLSDLQSIINQAVLRAGTLPRVI